MSIKITDTTLRDAHQSLYATRTTTKDMVPILESIDQVGYHSLEMWGGATFDSCMRYLDEDPWERLRTIRKHVKNTNLQMLLRGQNIVGYKNYPDDVLEAFVKRAIANGLDIIRIFDALNDLRNMEKAIQFTKQEGAHAQGTICYTISPIHTIETFVDIGLKLEAEGCDSICIKDMAGLLAPYEGYELVKRLKEETNVPIQLHSHCTSGMATTTYIKAVEAGVDIIDTAISPFALGTSQPPIESIEAMLQGTENKIALNKEALREQTEYFKGIKDKYEKYSKMKVSVDANVLNYQLPGGMISNLTSQLSEANALDKYDEVLQEIPRVREELGYPPLVTPTSQIVGSQAVFNVLTGERYKMVTEEVKNYLAGQYGKPIKEVDPELKKQVLKDKEVITDRPANHLEPQLEKAREEIKDLIVQEEDVISYCLFPTVAKDFLQRRQEGKLQDLEAKEAEAEAKAEAKAEQKQAAAASKSSQPEASAAGGGQSGAMSGPVTRKRLRVTVEGQSYEVEVEPLSDSGGPAVTSIKPAADSGSSDTSGTKESQAKSTGEAGSKPKSSSEAGGGQESDAASAPTAAGETIIEAPIAGNVLKIQVSSGDYVNKGDVVMILEAMKMENEITADGEGEIKEIKVSEGSTVESGDPLIVLK